jgi:hypothetical protein
MNKNTTVMGWLFTSLVFVSCHNGPRHTTIETSDGTTSARIECAGDIQFTGDSSAVTSISPYGYIEYWGNDKHVLIESDEQGSLTYQLQQGQTNIPLDSTGKLFMAAALKEMITLGLRSGNMQESH